MLGGDSLTYLDQAIGDSRVQFIKVVAIPLAVLGFLLCDMAKLWRSRVSLHFCGFVGLAFVSVAWTTDVPTTTSYLLTQVAPIMLCSLALGTFRRDAILKALLRVSELVVFATVVACVVSPAARTQKVDPTLRSVEIIASGFRGTFIHKNLMAIAMVAAMVIALAFERRRDLRIAVLIAATVLVFLSRSGTGILSLVIPLSFPVLRFALRQTDRRVRTARISFIICATLVGALAAYFSVDAVLGMLGKDRTLSQRSEIWRFSIEAIRERPVLGYGWGGAYYNWLSEPTFTIHRKLGFPAAHAHSGVLMILLQVGLVGLVMVLTLLGRVIRTGMRLMVAGNFHEGFFFVAIPGTLLLAGFAEPTLSGAGLFWLAVMCPMLVHRDLPASVSKSMRVPTVRRGLAELRHEAPGDRVRVS